MRLSAAIIVRDEADHLRRCLASIREVVDEIVVVDTGSIDDTIEVANSFGAVVLHRPWDGNFSAPRNLGLDHVTGDWVLYIDADEHLVPTTRAHVEHELADPDQAHVGMRLRLKIASNFMPIWEHRLWRNRPDIRFEGVIHESHRQSIGRIIQREHLSIGDADLQLDHEGYEGDLTRKHRRNLPLLEAQVLNQPNRTYLWIHLGRVRDALGDHDGALLAWEHAVALVRRNGVRDAVDLLSYLDLVLARSADGLPAADLVAEAEERFGASLLTHWVAAVDAMRRDDHLAALDRLDRLLASDPDGLADAALTFDRRIASDWAYNARGTARFQLGDFAGAAADFATAEELDPTNVEYRTRRIVAEAQPGG